MPLSLNKAKKWLDRHNVPVVVGAVIMYILVFSGLTFWIYSTYGYAGFDLAYYHQIFWRTLQGEFFSQTLLPHLSVAYHVEPFILALVPLYAIFPDPRTLLVLQTIALAIPALPIYFIAKRRLGVLSSSFLRTAVPMFFPFAWLLHPSVHAANLDEFHLLSFALTPLFFAFLAYEKEKRVHFAILLVTALLMHESVAAVVIAFGALAWMERRGAWWMMFPSLLGGAWHAFALQVILRFNPDMGLSFAASPAGTALSGSLSFLLRVLDPQNAVLLLALGMPLFLLSFIRPQRLILAAVPFLQMLALGDVSVGIVGTAAVILLLPGVFIAAIEGSKVFPHVAHVIYGYGSDDRREAVFVLLTAAMLYSAITIGPLPGLIKQVVGGSNTALTHNARSITETITPTDAVAAPKMLLPHLSGRFDLISLPATEAAVMESLRNLSPTPDVIIIDARIMKRDAMTAPFIRIEP